MVKIVGAFVAGVVVAVGSALIYVRVSDAGHAQTAPAFASTRSAEAQSPVKPLSIDDGEQKAAPEAQPEAAKPPVDQPSVGDAPAAPSPAITPHKRPPNPVARRHSRPMLLARASAKTPAPVPASGAVSEPTPVKVDAPIVPVDAPTTTVAQTDYPPPVAASPAPEPHVVTLPAGTAIAIRLGETLSTDRNYTGDTFRGTLTAPVIMDGFVIADRGSKVLGRIVSAQKSGRTQGLANLVLTVTEINTTDGQRIRIAATTSEKKADPTVGQDAAKVAGGAALGAIIGALAGGGKGAAIGAGSGAAVGTGAVLLTRGKPAVISSETQISFRLAEPVTITEKFNN